VLVAGSVPKSLQLGLHTAAARIGFKTSCACLHAVLQVSPAPTTPDPQAVAAAADAVAGTGGLVAAAAGEAI
jgi:hypothetical protein